MDRGTEPAVRRARACGESEGASERERACECAKGENGTAANSGGDLGD